MYSPDLSSALTTETDPVVGAITGIVKADGNGNISAAVAGTDYSTFDGAFSSLTGKPTTISGYGITDAAPLASPALTGTPTAPTAGGGTSTTQIATTAFVQNAVTAGSGIQLTDLSVSTNTASGQGALGYNSSTGQFTFTPTDTSSFGNASLNSFSVSTTSASGAGSLAYNTANGVFSFTPADLSFGNISGTPTTVAGYGITDAAPLASPTFAEDSLRLRLQRAVQILLKLLLLHLYRERFLDLAALAEIPSVTILHLEQSPDKKQ